MKDHSLATVQLDVDGLWVLKQLAGEAWEIEGDDLFYTALSTTLDLFEAHGIEVTFFVNGADLSSPRKTALLRKAVDLGHEIANHGFSHSYLTSLSSESRRKEIADSSSAIQRALHVRAVGFRAPGYDMDPETLEILIEHGYVYDCSALPSSTFFFLNQFQKWILRKVSVRYPVIRPLVAPRSAYRPSSKGLYQRGTLNIIELPVSTCPVIRTPIHFSYASYLGARYVERALDGLIRRGFPIVYIFHLIDFYNARSSEIPSRLGGAAKNLEQKLEMIGRVLGFLKGRCEVVKTVDLVQVLRNRVSTTSPQK